MKREGIEMKTIFKITVKEEYAEECMEYIAEHTRHCKSELGNLTSEAYRSADAPNVAYIISEWDSPEHEKLHVESDADAEFVRKMQGKEAKPVEVINWTQLA